MLLHLSLFIKQQYLCVLSFMNSLHAYLRTLNFIYNYIGKDERKYIPLKFLGGIIIFNSQQEDQNPKITTPPHIFQEIMIMFSHVYK